MKLKRTLLILTILIIAVSILFQTNSTYAATSMELGIVSLREYGYGYQANGKNVWKIVEYTHGGYTFDKAIYCIKGGPGFGGSDYIENRVYNLSYDMKNIGSIPTEERNVLPSDEDKTFSIGGDIYTYTDYNAVLWLLDNIYLPADENAEQLKANLYDKAFPGMNHEDILLTDDDIEVVQQCAVWFFTNPDEDDPYHMETLPALQLTTQEGGQGPFDMTLDDLDPTFARQTQASQLYNYFINTARVKAQLYGKDDVRGEITIPAEFVETETSATISGGTCVIGPFRIEENPESELDYTIEAILKNQDGNEIYNYTLLDADKNPLSETTTLDEIVNTDFYIVIEDDEYVNKVTLEVVIRYYETTITFWTVGGAVAVEQPVVVVEKELKEISKSIDTSIVRKPFDLALRKFITQINSQNVQSREPQVDVTPLLNGETTAIYTHTKAPLTVTKGDIVKYTIRVYNEGEISGYADEVADYLPTGLGFLVGHKTNIQYGWELPETDNYETISLTEIENAGNNLEVTDFNNIESLSDVEVVKGRVKLSTNKLAYEEGSTKNLINAFDKTAQNPTLDYKDLEVVCIVLEEDVDNPDLKNIAEIVSDSDDQGNEIDDRDSTPDSVNVNTYPEEGNIEDDDDYEELILKPFDLALRKFITKINSTDIDSRVPEVDLSTLRNGTTATYNHTKAPLSVEVGDIVTYTIRVYNEGEVAGYAHEISDYIPEGLGFLVGYNTNVDNYWMLPTDGEMETVKLTSISNGTKNVSLSDFQLVDSLDEVDVVKGKVKISTNKLKYDPDNNENLLEPYDRTSETATLDYKDVQVTCIVLATDTDNAKLKNIAEITKDLNENGGEVDDRDSTPDTVIPEEYPDNSNIEDDDDYEQLVLKSFDLALRKFITAVEDKEIVDRIPTPVIDDVTGEIRYDHPKDPVRVQHGNTVIYTIRVYNEGYIDGYASVVRDDIPDGLEFDPTHEINIEYEWQLAPSGTYVYTEYLSKEAEDANEGRDNLIPAFDRNTMTGPAYKDVKIAFKVVEPAISNRVLINTAEIGDDSNSSGDEIEDIDSTPGNEEPAEDDIDIEKVQIVCFDLSLKKFITQVNDEQITNREPQVSLDDNGNLQYTYVKDPVTVRNNDVVIYTIRIYNEGNIDGYATEIKDDVPQGLVFLPEHEVNIEYRWQLSEDGTIRTDYLSEEQSTDNIIEAFDKDNMREPNYKDVKVAFRVDESAIPDTRIIINTAEISEDDNEYDAPDIDSTPDNDVPTEDDIDKEYLIVEYFDLSLLKWLSKVEVTVDGETTTTTTNFTGLEDPDPIVKVDINKNKINQTVVKFIYTIKITNEGQIEGYATEIRDDIPEGLEFRVEDNPDWYIDDNGRVVTNALQDELLYPGESATVDITLRWINNENNLGVKINVAEISEDDNESDSPDIDSTPDNKVEGEDDIDEAPVALSIVTGSAPLYIGLTTSILLVLAGGVFLIKKYVL